MSKKIITPVNRASFVHLVEPKAPAPGADPVYSAVAVLPKKLKAPWKDGDEEDRPEWEGCWVVSCKNKTRPGVVGPDLRPIMDPEQLYSGAFYRFSMSAWGWSHPTGGKGVSLNLDNAQWVKDGEAFTSRSKAEDDFAAFKTDAPADEDVEEVEFE